MKLVSLLAFFCAALIAGAAENAAATRSSTDRPGGVQQTVAAQFPIRLLRQGILQGEAQVLIEIGRDGSLADLLPVAYTHRLFSDAAVDAVKQWRLQAAIVGGQPTRVVVEVTFQFGVDGVLAIETRAADLPVDAKSFENRFVYRPVVLSKLDRIPLPVDVAPPVYPREWADQGRKGSVTIVFYIDETGRARVPSAGSYADEQLAAAAIDAVKSWRFAPPTSQGRPVLVRAQQTFTFDPAEIRAAAAAPK